MNLPQLAQAIDQHAGLLNAIVEVVGADNVKQALVRQAEEAQAKLKAQVAEQVAKLRTQAEQDVAEDRARPAAVIGPTTKIFGTTADGTPFAASGVKETFGLPVPCADITLPDGTKIAVDLAIDPIPGPLATVSEIAQARAAQPKGKKGKVRK